MHGTVGRNRGSLRVLSDDRSRTQVSMEPWVLGIAAVSMVMMREASSHEGGSAQLPKRITWGRHLGAASRGGTWGYHLGASPGGGTWGLTRGARANGAAARWVAQWEGSRVSVLGDGVRQGR